MAGVRSLGGQNHDRFETPTADLPLRSNALSSKLTSMLSTSYADLDVRDALDVLDQRGIDNTPETRRQLRLDVQKEVIQCNGEVIRDFGQVAEVSPFSSCSVQIIAHSNKTIIAIEAYRVDGHESKPLLS